ncbi:cell envelope biogenesis protein TolA [Serratia ficaria]|uniref:cell envelope biogenesis protein TolA n=1 Tax=Serratia ficaria TaxID=61651 RepID=UPI00217B7697|nr:cell envelope biogenesis protein TolA [Serratia ficaria]CAI2080857.1 Uncharacterised protein [Serratia ficaria]
MSEEKTEVALVSLPSAPAELEQAFINDEFIDNLIKNIRDKASSVVGDLNKAAGRKVYISMAATVRSTKVMIDDAGKELVAEMKKRPALVDASRRKVREALDELAVEIRKPVTDWEAEQERLKVEEEAKRQAEALAKQVESDHEIALLLNEKFDREVAEAKAEAERQRIAHEEELKRQAAEQAKRDAEAEIAAAAQRESDAKAALEKAKQDAKDAATLAEQQRIEAEAKAERDKQAAIEAEQLRAKQEAERIRLESEQKETARLAEEKRIADEKARREQDVEHRRTINRQSVAELVAAGLPADCAQKCVEAIAKGEVSAIRITY